MSPDYLLLFHKVPGLYLVLSPDLKIVAVNDAYLSATMTHRDDIVGKGIFEVFPDNPDDPNADGVSNLSASLKRVLHYRVPDAMPVQKYDIQVPGKSEFEVRYWSPLNSPVFDNDSNLLYIIHRVQDVTEIVLLQQQSGSEEMARIIEQQNAALNTAKNELAAALSREKELSELKSRFLTMASHEFRTPLSTILSSAYLSSQYKDAEDAEKRERHLQRIVNSVELLTDLLDDFLSIGKIEEGKHVIHFQCFDIKVLIEDLLNDLSATLKYGQSLHYTHTGNNFVYTDPAVIKHMLMNLISNAKKFSNEGKAINIDTVQDDEKLSLCVSDNGIGIAPHDMQYLFERFFRGSNVTNIQGTGLGLHLVGKYAEMLGGTVNCESELYKGTTFRVTIPLQ